MQVEIFGKEECPLCQNAKEIIGERMKLDYRYWDLQTSEGMAEYCFRDYPTKFKMKYPVVAVGEESFHSLGEVVKFIKRRLKQ